MRIGIPIERLAGEKRVAATPVTVPALAKLGYEVIVEKGAGEEADFSDEAYAHAGAMIGTSEQVWSSDLVLCVNAPDPAQVELMKPEAMLVGLLAPRQNLELLQALRDANVTGLAVDMVPRISRAQSMDALSSMANIAGYRAVVEAAHAFGRFLGGQVTAAGKVLPAKVFVIGTGVAGLAAIGAAKSLGALVRATDVRPETAEQVTSMGATFVQVRAADEDQGVSADGYAKETSDDYNKRAGELYAEQAREVDIIITTAAIPGKSSPKLITAEMVASMQPGSIIVDLAAAGGGNCELTKPGESYVTDNGVTIIGFTDFPSRLPGQASQLYGTNLVNLVKLLTPASEGRPVIDFDDEVIRAATVTRDGEITFPPPPVQVSVAPVIPRAIAEPPQKTQETKTPRPLIVDIGVVGTAAVVGVALLSFAPPAFLSLLLVFALATIVGYYVVWGVNPALHTPLMSVTNAISGIIVVGALLQMADDAWLVKILAFIAVGLASFNIFGGFAVTHRMLAMFRKD